MTPKLRYAATVFAFALAAAPAAQAANPVAKAIEQAKPCSRLKVKALGLAVGLDKFESAAVKTLQVDVDGDHAKFALDGSLACTASDTSLLRGDASAELRASFTLDLASCEFSDKSIRIVATGGSFGSVLQAAKPQIEAALDASLENLAKSLCK
jgi:hypothetical protein